MATSAPGGNALTHSLTRRSVADVRGTQLLAAAVAVHPLKHTAAPAGVSHVSSETFAHLPSLPPIAQHVVPQYFRSSSRLKGAALSIESPRHPPTAALHACLGGLCFNLASVTRDTRFARHRSSFACTTRRPSSREIARRGGGGSRRELFSHSLSPIRHATYWSSRTTASVVISRAVCAPLPPDEQRDSATPFSRQDKPEVGSTRASFRPRPLRRKCAI